jgi:thymidine phosphorylase
MVNPEVDKEMIEVCVGKGARLRVQTEAEEAAVGLVEIGAAVVVVVVVELAVPPISGASTVAVG